LEKPSGRNIKIPFLKQKKSENFRKIRKRIFWYNNIKPYKTNGFSTFIVKLRFLNFLKFF